MEDKELPPLDSNGKPVKYSEAPSRPGKSGGSARGESAVGDEPAEFTLEPDTGSEDAPAIAPAEAESAESGEAAAKSGEDDNKRNQ